MTTIKKPIKYDHTPFKSIQALGNYVAGLTDTDRSEAGARQCSSITADSGFTNGITLNDAIKMAQQGGRWEAGAHNLATAELNANVKPESKRAMLTFATTGCRPSVQRYLASNPRNMAKRKAQPIKQKVLKLGIDIGASGKCTQADYTRRGVAVLSYVKQLETAGYSVELHAIGASAVNNGAIQSLFSVIIKPANAKLCAADIAFALCHSGFDRRLGFAVYETAETTAAEITGGKYGNGTGVIYPAGFDAVLPFMGLQMRRACQTDESAIEHVYTELNNQLNKDKAAA